MLTSRGLGVVLADLSQMGFDAKWGVVSAADVGANHQRERIWILANTKLHGFSATQDTGSTKETTRQQQTRENNSFNTTRTSGLPATASNVAYPYQQFGWANETKQQKRDSFGQSFSNSGLDGTSKMAYTNSERGCLRKTNGENAKDVGQSPKCATRPEWWSIEPNVGRVAHGVAARVDRLKAIGNGQVPLCAATAWELLR